MTGDGPLLAIMLVVSEVEVATLSDELGVAGHVDMLRSRACNCILIGALGKTGDTDKMAKPIPISADKRLEQLDAIQIDLNGHGEAALKIADRPFVGGVTPSTENPGRPVGS